MEVHYPKSYAARIMVPDAIIFIIGVALMGFPFAKGYLPGDFDTTVHVGLGALIAVLSVFRVLLAYGSSWPEIPTCFLGFLVFMLPTYMHQHWNPAYATPHMAAGIIVMVLSALSFLMTTVEMRKPQYRKH